MATLEWDVKAMVTECFRVFICIGACTENPHRYYDNKPFPTLALALKHLLNLVKNELPPSASVDIRLCTRDTIIVKDVHVPRQILCIWFWDQEQRTFLVDVRPAGWQEIPTRGATVVDREPLRAGVPNRAPREQRGAKRKNSDTQTDPEHGRTVD